MDDTFIDYYKTFDPKFFRERHREESAQQYRELLSADIVRSTNILSSLTHTETLHPDMIPKPYLMSITKKYLAKKAGVELEGSQLNYLGGRNKAHLTRLLLPEQYYTCGGSMHYSTPFTNALGAHTQVTQTFAKEFIAHAATLPQEEKNQWEQTRSAKFLSVSSAESHSVFVFWTIVPYVHLGLKEQGKTSSQSVEAIIDWVCRAEKNWQEYSHYLDGDPDVSTQLGFDERMPSHLLARLEANRILSDVLGREQ